jgi:hypothetical protein
MPRVSVCVDRESLAFQPFFTASAANVGFGYWSHDIGGFMSPVDGELYTRWIQLGALSPVFRTHGSRAPLNIKRLWYYDQQVSLNEHARIRNVVMRLSRQSSTTACTFTTAISASATALSTTASTSTAMATCRRLHRESVVRTHVDGCIESLLSGQMLMAAVYVLLVPIQPYSGSRQCGPPCNSEQSWYRICTHPHAGSTL